MDTSPIAHQLLVYEKKIFIFGNYVSYRPSMPFFRSYRHRIPKNPQGGVRSLTYTLSPKIEPKSESQPRPPKISLSRPTVNSPLEW